MGNVLDVLIVDNDDETRLSYAAFLRLSGLSVESEPNALAALRVLGKKPVLVVVSGDTRYGPTGLSLLETVRSRWPKTGRVLFTKEPGSPQRAIALGALVLSKRDSPNDVRRAIIAEVQDAERRHQDSTR